MNGSGKTPKRDYLDEVRKLWYKFSLNKMSVVGLGIVALVLIVSVFQPLVAPYPTHIGAVVDFKNANRGPCADYWLGTDTVGRDIMSRIFYAYRGAFTMGLGVLAATVPLGSVLGMMAGYWKGRWFSTFIMRMTDIFLALPPMILALCVCSILRPTLFNSLLAMCVAWWPWYTRLAFGMTTSLRNEMYVKSAELLGASKPHILFREILPNCTGSILTKATLDMGWVILTGATLSFVGLGEQPPLPALGTMVSDGAKYLPAQWWLSIFPALAIMIIVLGFNLMGDGVKDMLSGEE
ncbi:MAG: ABC transporter permease [Synergistaceae bacterium]|jgi:peptide/nickel transport system permease protein|nr:ABC transporter permease [Synergistaceae bacterium]